jgi:molecular chaperone DnaK (HSP70)
MMADIYGIDLGTTQSCIARINRFELPEVLNSIADSTTTTPSVVYYDERNTPVVGATAKESWFGSKPERTVICIKRKMNDRNYQRRIGTLTLNPVDVSAQILKKIVDDANLKLRNEEGNNNAIKKVVITVPAYFGSLERDRTKKAGESIGLEVVQLICEPDAAAMSYFSNNMTDKTILVYDLGGGTFDASIVKIRNQKPETIGIGGDSELGGYDWDKALAEFALRQAGLQNRIPDIERLTQDDSALLLAAEKCKKSLSETQVSMLSFVYNDKRYNININRSDFVAYTKRLVDKTKGWIIEAAKRADTRPDKPSNEPKILKADGTVNVDEIILVGGASRMPMIRNMIRNDFRKEPILTDPDLSVAKGAAIYANKLLNNNNTGLKPITGRGSRSYGLGVQTDNNKRSISNLIKLNETMVIETRKFENRYQLTENMRSVSIRIFENESNEDCIDMGTRQPVKEGILQFDRIMEQGTIVNIYLSRDASGIVNLRAESNGKQVRITVNTI